VTVTVNGAAVPVIGGWFSVPVNLEIGTNTITIRAVDSAGNSVTRILMATRTSGTGPAAAGEVTTGGGGGATDVTTLMALIGALMGLCVLALIKSVLKGRQKQLAHLKAVFEREIR
jgi:hypothetical protein